MSNTACKVSVVSAVVLAVTMSLLTHDSNAEHKDDNTKCDLYKGSWVFDKSYPLYDSAKCPLILQQFNCPGNGRPDLRYQKYRWQPNNCNLTRWDEREVGSKMRGKRIMFVGDSLSMNQWQSLACMILSSYPRSPYHPTNTPPLSTIFFPELNLTLMYMRNALIVDLEIQKTHKVLKLDSINSATANQWLQTDVLIFDTWHWWLHTGRKQPWDLIQDGKIMRREMDRLKAYERGLMTWTKWINKNLDANKVKVFFQGVSPDHWNASDWGMPETQQCGGEEEPLKQAAAVESGGINYRSADFILKKVLKRLKKPVHLLDIEELSKFRVDGHPSIYGNPKKIGMDCTHWCLPGVPDTWNQLLYATLLTF
ncbi:hypothetical protein ABFS83_08G205100 [Erythranthe nasuta]